MFEKTNTIKYNIGKYNAIIDRYLLIKNNPEK